MVIFDVTSQPGQPAPAICLGAVAQTFLLYNANATGTVSVQSPLGTQIGVLNAGQRGVFSGSQLHVAENNSPPQAVTIMCVLLS
jgi:hypothetical protein